MIVQYLYPEGKRKALTFSYDDGNDSDRRLAEIFTRYGMKATFNLNSAYQNKDGKIHLDELQSVLIDHGHEVACHGATHPLENQIALSSVIEDIRDDRVAFEKALGMPVRGMAYPFGTYNDDVKTALRVLGIVYCRTVKATQSLGWQPDDWLEWHPSAHHENNIFELGDKLLNSQWGCSLLYVWGHAFEFDTRNNWNRIEEFCAKMANHDSIWYATNIEIYEYSMACRNLIVAMDGRFAKNPSVLTVWVGVSGNVYEIPPGQTVFFE